MRTLFDVPLLTRQTSLLAPDEAIRRREGYLKRLEGLGMQRINLHAITPRKCEGLIFCERIDSTDTRRRRRGSFATRRFAVSLPIELLISFGLGVHVEHSSCTYSQAESNQTAWRRLRKTHLCEEPSEITAEDEKVHCITGDRQSGSWIEVNWYSNSPY